MGIDIERHAYGGVPDQIRDDFRTDAAGKESSCPRVVQIVETDRRQPRALQRTVKVCSQPCTPAEWLAKFLTLRWG